VQKHVRKGDAETFELDQKRARQMGAHALSRPSRQPLDEWLDSWWAIESPLWAASTRSQPKDVLDRWVRPRIGVVRLSDLGRKRVNEWRAEITAAGCKPTQANQPSASRQPL
jgi:hypothetical protein